MSTGERIRWAREASGLSINQVARLMQTSPDMILAMEQDRITPSFSDLGQFVTLYDVSMDYLRYGIERDVVMPANQMTDDDCETLRTLMARRRQD